jgi:membrane-associated phospholipid phosphatase
MPGPDHEDHLAEQPPRDAKGAGARTRLSVLPRPRHWVLWVLLLSAAVSAVGLGAQLVPGFSTAELGVDQGLSSHHVPVLTVIAMALNVLYAPLVGGFIILLISLYLLLVRRAPVNAVAFGLVASSGWVASEFFKIVIARHRPDPAMLFDPLFPETGSNSFPSGHTCFAVALAFALYFLARGSRWATATATAGAVMAVVLAWSRVYIGVHYPSDVAASFPAAIAAVVLLAGLWNRYAPGLLARHPFTGGPRPSRS